jgi:hypothetical protein
MKKIIFSVFFIVGINCPAMEQSLDNAAQLCKYRLWYEYFVRMKQVEKKFKAIAYELPADNATWVSLHARSSIDPIIARTKSGIIIECVNDNRWSMISPLGKWEFVTCTCVGDGDVRLRKAIEEKLVLSLLAITKPKIGAFEIPHNSTMRYALRSFEGLSLPYPDYDNNPADPLILKKWQEFKHHYSREPELEMRNES